eukprot:590010-Pyramimonas_sp.AAC.1
MASASRLSPKVHIVLQYRIWKFFSIENAVSVRLVKGTHKVPSVIYAGNCTLVHYGNDLHPGFHYYEAEGIALNIHGITGSAHSRIIKCLKSTQPQVGFDQEMTKSEELAGMPTQGHNAREAPEAETPQEDGWLPTIDGELEASEP